MTPVRWACIMALGLVLGLLPSPGRCQEGAKPVFGVALDGLPVTVQRLERVERELRLPIGMVVFFLQWPEEPDQRDPSPEALFPRQSLEAIPALGAVPCITWEPMYITAGGSEAVIPVERIVSGEYDPYIRSFAGHIKAMDAPVVIRLAHEPNIPRYHWGSVKGFGPAAPRDFKAIFRHVVTIFREVDALNARFVFCANAESYPFEPWNSVAAYYPGDEFVDILGIDGYNWGDTQTREKHGWDSRFRSFADIFGSMRGQLQSIAPDLPMMVFETASAATGGSKEKWLREMAGTARAWNLLGLCWFEADKEVDWRMKTGLRTMEPSALAPYFSHDFKRLFQVLEAGK